MSKKIRRETLPIAFGPAPNQAEGVPHPCVSQLQFWGFVDQIVDGKRSIDLSH